MFSRLYFGITSRLDIRERAANSNLLWWQWAALICHSSLFCHKGLLAISLRCATSLWDTEKRGDSSKSTSRGPNAAELLCVSPFPKKKSNGISYKKGKRFWDTILRVCFVDILYLPFYNLNLGYFAQVSPMTQKWHQAILIRTRIRYKHKALNEDPSNWAWWHITYLEGIDLFLDDWDNSWEIVRGVDLLSCKVRRALHDEMMSPQPFLNTSLCCIDAASPPRETLRRLILRSEPRQGSRPSC